VIALVAPAGAPIQAAPVEKPILAPSSPTAHGAQVVVIESSGRIRVDQPFPTLTQGVWASDQVGNPTLKYNWTNVAAGNFDGNTFGYQQIVATQSNLITVFAPFPNNTVMMAMTSPSGGAFDLLTVGDFNGDGRKEIAATYSLPNGYWDIAIYMYNPATNTWSVSTNVPGRPWTRWTDLQAANFNGDTADDLAMIKSNLVEVIFGGANNASGQVGWYPYPLDNNTGGFSYIAAAAGHMQPGTDRIATSRDVTNGATATVLLWQYGPGFALNDVTNMDTKFNPQFTSLSLADTDGDGFQELLMARNPHGGSTGLAILDFNTLIERDVTWTPVFNTVRGGDLNNDGKAETVGLNASQYQIYSGADAAGNGYGSLLAVPGSYYINPNVANATSLVVASLIGTVTVPILQVSPTSVNLGSVSFGQPSPAASLNLANSGAGNGISWTATVSDPWLHLDQTSGTTPATIQVTVDTIAHKLGGTPGSITINVSDPTVQNGHQTIPVAINVTDPGLLVTPNQIALYQAVGSAAPARSLQLAMPALPAGSTVDWYAGTASPAAAQQLVSQLADGSAKVSARGIAINGQIVAATPAWLILTPDSGKVGATPSTVTVTVDPTRLPSPNHPGVYQAMITIVAQDPSKPNYVHNVSVTYVLSSTPHYSYLPMMSR
jgi:hypothetical protein